MIDMDLGAWLIYISFGLAIVASVIALINLINFKVKYKKWSDMADIKIDFTDRFDYILHFLGKLSTILLFVTVSGTLLLLYVYFLTSNVDIYYVWEYSSTSLPLEYKISGVLAGMAGSLLFWIWCIAFTWFVEELIDMKRPKNIVLMNFTRFIMMVIIGIFLYFLITRDLFSATPKNLLEVWPEGYGLNPLLQTPLMIVHPPIVFLAYGFMAISLASSMAYLICNDKDWVKLTISWSRWGWLFLTLGIGIGGLWAYVVLGWGGYWSWDPVETSSFLPWILLTAFLHAQLMFRRKGDFKFAAPALGIYSFVLVIFATFTTRAGGIWQSVHAFEGADIEINPLNRFFDALAGDSVILGYFILMVGLAAIGTILLIWALIKRGGLEEESPDGKEGGLLGELINDKNLMFITLILFSVTTIITMLLLILAVNGSDREQFDTKVGFCAFVGVIILATCLIWKDLGRRAMVYTIYLTGGISLLLWFLFPDKLIVVTTMPFLALASGASIFKIAKSINTKSLRASVNATAPHLVHLGLVFIIVGFVASNFLTTEEKVTLTRDGPGQEVGNYDLRLTDGRYYPWDSTFTTIEISQNGNEVGTAEPGGLFIYKFIFEIGPEYRQYLQDGNVNLNLYLVFQEHNWYLSSNAIIYRITTDKWIIEDRISAEEMRLYQIVDEEDELKIYFNPQWRNEVRVSGTPLEDVYLIYNDHTNSGNIVTSVDLEVKILPLMSLLWLGMWLMAIGVFMRLIVDYTRPKKIPAGRVEKRAQMRAKKEKDTDYYEDLIEKELEEME